MKRALIATLVILGVTLACGQQIVTPTPTPSLAPSPVPSAMASPVPTATATEAQEDVQTATVRAAMVNVRAEPGGEVVGQLEAGTNVRVIGCKDDWCEVEAEQVSGFIFVGCLSIADGKGCVAK